MQTIWKYDLAVADVTELDMPIGARILTVQVQRTFPQLWAVVDPNTYDGDVAIGPAQTERRTFRIFGTGHAIEAGDGRHFAYVGTFQLADGAFVGHVFEDREGPDPLFAKLVSRDELAREMGFE